MTDRAQLLCSKIKELPADKRPQIIAVDGRCASGKTTLAAQLRECLSCSVIHMDDFFLRPEQRTKKRLEEPGGNVDYERFLREVLIPLRSGNEFSYRPFDCSTMSLSEPVRIVPGRICVVEGSYSCHPWLWDYYDLHIFLDVKQGEQMKRITARNGSAAAKIFRDRWIPLEEKYFRAFSIPARCLDIP